MDGIELRMDEAQFQRMFQYVRSYLQEHGGEMTTTRTVPFRRRSEHIRRVRMWAERLAEGLPAVDRAALIAAAIFHDVGHAVTEDRRQHAVDSARICEAYLRENGYPDEFGRKVVLLVENHSRKQLLSAIETPLELILLMEADWLDETGALSIVWDCMMEGGEAEQSFEKTYRHILEYSNEITTRNPMVTPRARELWECKQKLVRDFIQHLAYDLGIDPGLAQAEKAGLQE